MHQHTKPDSYPKPASATTLTHVVFLNVLLLCVDGRPSRPPSPSHQNGKQQLGIAQKDPLLGLLESTLRGWTAVPGLHAMGAAMLQSSAAGQAYHSSTNLRFPSGLGRPQQVTQKTWHWALGVLHHNPTPAVMEFLTPVRNTLDRQSPPNPPQKK